MKKRTVHFNQAKEGKTDYIDSNLQIENQYDSIISLLDAIYPPFSCTLCNTRCRSKTKLNQHYLDRHKERLKYLCIHPHCDKQYATKGALFHHTSTSHLINQATSTPLIENIPTFSSFYSRSKKYELSKKALQLLNRMYPPLQCPCCDLKLKKKTNVIKHLAQVHIGQEPYHCIYTKCKHPKLYATREGLVYHIRRFHGE